MSEPWTAAGRALVRALAGLSLGGDGFENAEDVQATVHRIEAEARAAAEEDAKTAVRVAIEAMKAEHTLNHCFAAAEARAAALDAWNEWADTEWGNGNMTNEALDRADAAIDALREGSK